MRFSSPAQAITYLKANAAQLDLTIFEQRETLALLRILALSESHVVAGRTKPARDAIAALRVQFAAAP